MPRPKKEKNENLTFIQEILKENDELKEDNKVLKEVATNLRSFNKDLVTDNLDSAMVINKLEGEIVKLKEEIIELEKDNKGKLIQALAICGVIALGMLMIIIGIIGE